MKSTCACNPRIWPCLSRVQTEKAANILKKSLIKNTAERIVGGKTNPRIQYKLFLCSLLR